jgi:hypothetical protein
VPPARAARTFASRCGREHTTRKVDPQSQFPTGPCQAATSHIGWVVAGPPGPSCIGHYSLSRTARLPARAATGYEGGRSGSAAELPPVTWRFPPEVRACTPGQRKYGGKQKEETGHQSVSDVPACCVPGFDGSAYSFRICRFEPSTSRPRRHGTGRSAARASEPIHARASDPCYAQAPVQHCPSVDSRRPRDRWLSVTRRRRGEGHLTSELGVRATPGVEWQITGE